MRKKILCIVCVLSLSFFAFSGTSHSLVESEGGVTISVNRVLHGATSGTKYYGYTGGTITLPNDSGGMLSFLLWNDMQPNGYGFTNYFNTTLGGSSIKIPNYATRNQLAEKYREFPNQWGPAGTSKVLLAIPPGISSFNFNSGGSITGIEISNLKFIQRHRFLPGGYEVQSIRRAGAPLIQVSRVLNGSKTSRKYYGYTGGSIFLPHSRGGFLTFKVWNDQNVGFASALNKIHLTVASRKDTFAQYTTNLDMSEEFREFPNQWGPAGGSDITIQIPEGVSRVNFTNSGSQTGVEISDVEFTKGAPIIIRFDEKVNRTTRVLNNFSRTLYGADSGRTFYGYTGGTILLPHNKGGVLSFLLWNDHGANAETTTNKLNITVGKRKETIPLTTTRGDRHEFYKRFVNQWGPAGGKEVRVTVPSGVSSISVNNGGSQTGIELSDFSYGEY